MRRKMKWSLIQDKTTRKTTFKKRKKGMLKKLTELVTLCDVKACAVIYSAYDLNPEIWPSKEGVEEVVSNFMKLSVEERTKKTMDQEAFIRQRIATEKEKLQKLCDENRDIEIQNVMFDCVKGKMDVHHLDEKNLRDLSYGIDKYLNKLNCRNEILTGESSSVVADVAVPDGFCDNMIQYHNQNQNQQKPVQFQYKTLFEFYDQLPQKIHDFNMNVNSKKSMLPDLNLSLNIGEDEDIPSMDNF